MYWVTCPHCKKTIEQGSGARSVKIGTPITMCPECNKIIVDHDVFEWSVVSNIRRFVFCSYGSGRILFHFLTLLVSMIPGSGFFAMIFASLISEAAIGILLFYLVRSYYEDDIRESYKRAEIPNYIELLKMVEYRKLSWKYQDS